MPDKLTRIEELTAALREQEKLCADVNAKLGECCNGYELALHYVTAAQADLETLTPRLRDLWDAAEAAELQRSERRKAALAELAALALPKPVEEPVAATPAPADAVPESADIAPELEGATLEPVAAINESVSETPKSVSKADDDTPVRLDPSVQDIIWLVTPTATLAELRAVSQGLLGQAVKKIDKEAYEQSSPEEWAGLLHLWLVARSFDPLLDWGGSPWLREPRLTAIRADVIFRIWISTRSEEELLDFYGDFLGAGGRQVLLAVLEGLVEDCIIVKRGSSRGAVYRFYTESGHRSPFVFFQIAIAWAKELRPIGLFDACRHTLAQLGKGETRTSWESAWASALNEGEVRPWTNHYGGPSPRPGRALIAALKMLKLEGDSSKDYSYRSEFREDQRITTRCLQDTTDAMVRMSILCLLRDKEKERTNTALFNILNPVGRTLRMTNMRKMQRFTYQLREEGATRIIRDGPGGPVFALNKSSRSFEALAATALSIVRGKVLDGRRFRDCWEAVNQVIPRGGPHAPDRVIKAALKSGRLTDGGEFYCIHEQLELFKEEDLFSASAPD